MSTIFTDYASRFLAQSRQYAQLPGSRSYANGNPAPLFYSAADMPIEGFDDDDNVAARSIALESSRRQVGMDSAYTDENDSDAELQDEPLHTEESIQRLLDDNDGADSVLRHQLLTGHSPSNSRQYQPSSIYQEQPTPHVAPKANANTLSQGLLPSSSIPPILMNSHRRSRKYNDATFAALYLAAMTIMTLVGCYTLLTTSSNPLENVTKGTIYGLLKQSAGIFTVNIIVSVLLGAFWIYFLRLFVKQLVWGTVVIVPIAGVVLFITALASSFTGRLRERGGSDPQDDSLAWLSAFPLITALVFARILYGRRKRLHKTISIVRLACEILKDNPQLVVISSALLFAFIVFSVIWLILFARLFLVGKVVSDASGNRWFVSGDAWMLIIFFWSCYMWTWEVFSGIQRVTASSVVAQWYFHRNDPNADSPLEISRIAFQRATSLNFGSICLGGLVLTGVQAGQFLTRTMRKYVKSPSAPCMPLFTACLACLDGILDNLNAYILTQCGISGEAFFPSARTTTKIFRRNLVFGLTNDMVTKMVLMVGSLVVSLACGLAGFIIATHTFASPYGYITGILGALIAWQVTGFYTKILTSIVDAAFVCYTIDLDVNSNHCSMAMEAFGNDTDGRVPEV